MAAAFYIVHIDRAAHVSLDQLKEKMDLSTDWYRVNSRLWLLHTTSSAEKWHRRLKPLIDDDGKLFICKLDVTDRQGWMSNDFWDWIRRRERSKSAAAE